MRGATPGAGESCSIDSLTVTSPTPPSARMNSDCHRILTAQTDPIRAPRPWSSHPSPGSSV